MLRKDPRYSETLTFGAFEPWLAQQHNLMAYLRKGEDQTILIMGNFQPQPQTVPLPGPVGKVLLTNTEAVHADGPFITLDGYQAVVIELKKSE